MMTPLIPAAPAPPFWLLAAPPPPLEVDPIVPSELVSNGENRAPVPPATTVLPPPPPAPPPYRVREVAHQTPP